MNTLVQDVAAAAMLDERWCPVYTPFWLHEAANFIRLSSIDELEQLELNVLSLASDDPSARSERLSFWSVFRLRAYDTMGPASFRRMLGDDTLVLWEDQVEANLVAHFDGYMSVAASITITLTCTPEPTLIPTCDWTALGKPFRSAAIWAASCLQKHRMLCHPSMGPR